MNKTLQQKNNIRTRIRGNILTLAVLIFTMASLALAFGIVSPIVKHIKNVRGAVYSKQAFYTAESLQEDLLYRMKKNYTYSSPEILVLGNSTSTAEVFSETTGKRIVVDSDTFGYKRKISATVTQGAGVTFSYGVQAGLGGFDIDGTAKVNGNVYSNGDIYGGGTITGTAISATVSNPVADQLNDGASSPPFSIDLGGNATPPDVAQSFKISTTTPLTSVRLYIKKSSINPINDITVQIVNDLSGNPGTTVLGSVIMNASQVGTSYDYIELPFSSPISLVLGTQYWIVLYSPSTSSLERYSIGATNNTYATGTAQVGTWVPSAPGSWVNTTPSGLDIYFGLYVSGKVGSISNVSVGTGAGGGDAWAHTITSTTVNSGIKYCKVGTGCNTSRPDPVTQPYPISNGNISDWKAEAVLGGTITSTTTGSSKTLGPIKVDGNLTVDGILYLNGTIWVTGDFKVTGTKVQLASSYGSNSGMIIVDGKTLIENNVTFSGYNGATSSYVMLLSTNSLKGSTGDCAIDVKNNAGAVLLNAQNGSIFFKNNATAKSVTAYKIELQNGVEITYDLGIIDLNFYSGPSGSWNINSWQEGTP